MAMEMHIVCVGWLVLVCPLEARERKTIKKHLQQQYCADGRNIFLINFNFGAPSSKIFFKENWLSWDQNWC